MNRRTFFTSLASLGASPALGVGPEVSEFILTKGTRPFSGDAPFRTEWPGYWLPENVHLFPQQLAVLNEPPRRSIPVLSPRR